jgi:leader peptidase (prepilin peptidase)/N-methyltransferase
VLVLDLPNWFWLSVGGLVGLCVGSFLNVVIYRVPRGMSLSHPPSTCPGCGARIPAYLNVPVLGYLALAGKARCCKMSVSPRYPLIELLGGTLGCSVMATRILPEPTLPLHLGLAHFALYFGLCAALVAASAIDLEHMILPDAITLGGTAVGLASAGIRPEVGYLGAAIAAVAGFIVVWFPFIWLHGKWRGYPGMGLGDAKLLALAGAWFGGAGVVFALFAGAFQGTLVAAVTLLSGRRLEEPAAVLAERQEFLRELEAASPEERAELERIQELDPVLREPDGTSLGARIPFGPFLALALIELALFYEKIQAAAEAWFLP